MNKKEILIKYNKLALDLIEEHLSGKDYVFKFDRAKKRLGSFQYSFKKGKLITLSKYFVMSNAEHYDFIRKVILHEIAHALTYEKYGPDAKGHSEEWKEICEKIGGNCDITVKGIDMGDIPSYDYICPNCGKVSHYYRKLKKRKACGACCRKYNNGKFDERFTLQLKNKKELIATYE